MIRQEVAIRLVICWQHYLLAIYTAKILGVVFLRLTLTKSGGEANSMGIC